MNTESTMEVQVQLSHGRTERKKFNVVYTEMEVVGDETCICKTVKGPAFQANLSFILQVIGCQWQSKRNSCDQIFFLVCETTLGQGLFVFS